MAWGDPYTSPGFRVRFRVELKATGRGSSFTWPRCLGPHSAYVHREKGKFTEPYPLLNVYLKVTGDCDGER